MREVWSGDETIFISTFTKAQLTTIQHYRALASGKDRGEGFVWVVIMLVMCT